MKQLSESLWDVDGGMLRLSEHGEWEWHGALEILDPRVHCTVLLRGNVRGLGEQIISFYFVWQHALQCSLAVPMIHGNNACARQLLPMPFCLYCPERCVDVCVCVI